jgi:outer membrane protein assembly factor BamD (BamD/ComL family)
MKKSMCSMLVTFLLVSSVQAQETDWIKQDGDWQKHYVQALAGFEQGDYESAAEEFENAIGCEPMPQEGAIDYLPYVHLAVARFKLGQADAARYALTQSHNHGVAANTSRGKSMLAQYSVPIMDTPTKP